MSKPTRPLRPQSTHRATYPHHNEPSRYVTWVGPLVIGSAMVLTSATASAQVDQIPEVEHVRGEAVAVPTYDQRVPAEGAFDVPLTDGGYARVAVMLHAPTLADLDRVVADAELVQTIQLALASQDCHSIHDDATAQAVLTAILARQAGAATLSQVTIEVSHCESYAAPPGEPPVIEEDMPLPGLPPHHDVIDPAPPVDPPDADMMPSPGEPPMPDMDPAPPVDPGHDAMPLPGAPPMPDMDPPPPPEDPDADAMPLPGEPPMPDLEPPVDPDGHDAMPLPGAPVMIEE